MREGHWPYRAREVLGLEINLDTFLTWTEPDWCFCRMGMRTIQLADGRRISIGGEYEDFTDPNFCIYNDVVVQRGNEVEIYTYPTDVFPPTDFHTATLVDKTIWLIGSVGYQELRMPFAQVLALDTVTYELRQIVATTAQSPGWIHRHKATLLDDGFTIEIRGGVVSVTKNGSYYSRCNTDVYHFDTRTAEWSKLTNTESWRQFVIEYIENRELRAHGCSISPSPSHRWYNGEILTQLGYPVELAPSRNSESADSENVTNEAEDYWHLPAHAIFVDGIPVRICDCFLSLHVTIEGVLPPAQVVTLLIKLKELLEFTNRRTQDPVEL